MFWKAPPKITFWMSFVFQFIRYYIAIKLIKCKKVVSILLDSGYNYMDENPSFFLFRYFFIAGSFGSIHIFVEFSQLVFPSQYPKHSYVPRITISLSCINFWIRRVIHFREEEWKKTKKGKEIKQRIPV